MFFFKKKYNTFGFNKERRGKIMVEKLITQASQRCQCCFCGISLHEHNRCNPDPACTMDGAFCCRYCDEHIVMPARAAINMIIRNALPQKSTT